MKRDVTKTGVRTKQGAFDDAVSGAQRYFMNNYRDPVRQRGLDLLLGVTTSSLIATTATTTPDDGGGVGGVIGASSTVLGMEHGLTGKLLYGDNDILGVDNQSDDSGNGRGVATGKQRGAHDLGGGRGGGKGRPGGLPPISSSSSSERIDSDSSDSGVGSGGGSERLKGLAYAMFGIRAVRGRPPNRAGSSSFTCPRRASRATFGAESTEAARSKTTIASMLAKRGKLNTKQGHKDRFKQGFRHKEKIGISSDSVTDNAYESPSGSILSNIDSSDKIDSGMSDLRPAAETFDYPTLDPYGYGSIDGVQSSGKSKGTMSRAKGGSDRKISEDTECEGFTLDHALDELLDTAVQVWDAVSAARVKSLPKKRKDKR